MRVQSTAQDSSLSILSANAIAAAASGAEELPDFSGRTLSTFSSRKMREDFVPSDLSDDSLGNCGRAGSHDGSDSGSSASSSGSARFAVIVPIPKDALPDPDALSNTDSDTSESARSMPVLSSQSPAGTGRVMAVVNNALNFFRPHHDPRQPQQGCRQSLPAKTLQSGVAVDSIRSLGSAGEALIQRQLTLDPNYLKRCTEGAERIEYDDCVDICFMPNRTGTRAPAKEMKVDAHGIKDLLKLVVPSTEAMASEAGRVATLRADAPKYGPLCHHMRVEPVNSDGKIEGCFMCHPDAGQFVVMDREFRVRDAQRSDLNPEAGVMMTLNKKPYTDKEHILVFPTKHMPQAYNADLFAYSLYLLAAAETGNKLIDDQAEPHEAHNYTVLFAGPVGGSQSHHHQHLINKKTNFQKYIESNPQSVKKLAFSDKPNSGVFRVTSEALKTFKGDDTFVDPKRGELRFFDCLMVKGDADYVEKYTTKIIDHLNEKQADGTVRARYNMAILPTDVDGNYRSIIFPRSTEEGTDHLKRPILWGDNTFPPSSHEMCGHWFMTKLPVNKSTVSQEEFDYNVRRAIYKAAHDIRAPIDSLSLDRLFKDEITLVPSAGVRINTEESSADFPAAQWYGWDDIAVDGERRSTATANQKPLRACLKKPDNLPRDTDFIKPEMSQAKVNELYETLDFVSKLFKQFEVPYFGGAGTSLSAVRHGGQMPNDDDADFFLPFSAAKLFESEPVQDCIQSQGYRVDTYSELSAEKGTDLVYQIRKNDGRELKDAPFVDIAFMQASELDNKPVWVFSVARKDGSRSYYRLPGDGFESHNMREIYFGRRKDELGEIEFKGVPIMVPNEKNVMFHLDGAYGKNWYQTNFVPGIGPLYISDRGHIPYKGDKL